MELREKLENIEKLRAESFKYSLNEKYGIVLEDGNVDTFIKMLNEIKDKQPNDKHVGFKFTRIDIVGWLSDLDYCIKEYKQISNKEYLPSNTKLRDLIKKLTNYLMETSNPIVMNKIAKQIHDLHGNFIGNVSKELTESEMLGLKAKNDIAKMLGKRENK